MKALFISLFSIFTSTCLFAFGPGWGNPGGPGGGGGGQQPGGGGNQPDQPGGGGGGGGGAFTYDTFLTDSATAGGCVVYGDLMTGYADGQTSIAIPSSVTRIADGALAGNGSVVSIDASSATGLVSLPESFAMDCRSLASVSLPSTITEICASAFAMDSSLESIELNEGLAEIRGYALYGVACTNLTVPATVSRFGYLDSSSDVACPAYSAGSEDASAAMSFLGLPPDGFSVSSIGPYVKVYCLRKYAEEWAAVVPATSSHFGGYVSLPYVIRFDGNGCSYGSMADQTCEFGVVYRLPSCGFRDEQRTFCGWSCSNGKRYDDGVLVYDLSDSGETVTMTAIWGL